MQGPEFPITCSPAEGAHSQLDRGNSVHGDRYDLYLSVAMSEQPLTLYQRSRSRQASSKSAGNTMEHDLLGVGAWAIPYHEVTVPSSVEIGTAQGGNKFSFRAKSILCKQYVHAIMLPPDSSQPRTTATSYDARRRISLEHHVQLERRRAEYGMLERYLEEMSRPLIFSQ